MGLKIRGAEAKTITITAFQLRILLITQLIQIELKGTF